MTKCWASTLGGCSPEQSKEHMVSAALWEGASIAVVGLPWCKTTPKTVSIASLASKILCKTHNNGLSDTDAAAAQAFATLRQATALINERGLAPQHDWPLERFEITAPGLLERWFVKTALNLCVVSPGSQKWRQTGEGLDRVPDRLVRMAFGLEPIVPPYGLYGVASMGDQMLFRDIIEFAPVHYGNQGMIAGRFTFRGLRFLLHMEPHQLPSTLMIPNARESVWRSGRLQHHPNRVDWKLGSSLSHYVQFLW